MEMSMLRCCFGRRKCDETHPEGSELPIWDVLQREGGEQAHHPKVRFGRKGR